MRKPTVFISSSVNGLPIAQEFALQLEPTVIPALWSGAFHLGKTVTKSLTEVADRADFAIFVLTAADGAGDRKRRSRIPSLNVMFEMGFLAGRIGLSRTFVVVADPGRALMPSDLAGVMFLQLLRPRAESDLRASVAPVSALIAKTIAELGLRPERRPELSSCFISYSWRDKDFAARLHGDLEQVGVRSWLDAKELQVGDSISEQVGRAMQAHDKVLLVLSQSSVRSAWVHLEMRKAFELESARESTVLFPLRLDEAVFATAGTPDFDRLKDRLILDFSGWQDKAQYQRAFSMLVRDLAISASVESERRK